MLLFALAVGTIATLQTTNVQAETTMKTYAISDAIPNPIGLGESTLLKCGISQAAANATSGWSGITITVTKPDGTTETLGPFTTDSTGSTYTRYTPDQVGNYTLTTNVPNQTVTMTYLDNERGQYIYAGTVLLASTANCTLEVTSEPTQQTYPGHALPSEYWSRPIDPQLREWYSISGNWVSRPDNSVALYNDYAPETAHVLWAQTLASAGMEGGLLGTDQIPVANFAGDAYEGKFSNSVIIDGVLYYNTGAAGTYGTVSVQGIQAVDLHTGEKLWFLNNTALSFGQTLFFPSYNVNGAFNYIYSVSGTTWTAYNAYDGSWAFTFTDVPSGIRVYGPNGELLVYQIDYTNGWMALWNSTLAGLQNASPGTPQYGSWSFSSALKTMNASLPKCYSWNVTIPKGLATVTELGSSSLKVYQGDRIVGVYYNQSEVRIWALDISDITPTLTANVSSPQSISTLYDKTWTAPDEWLSGSNTIHYTGATNYVTDDTYGNGVVAVWDKELRTHYGFSVVDGSYLWATSSENYLDMYGWGNVEHTWYFAYGKLYSVGVAGILYAYDLSTGKTAWTYNLTDAYGEPVTGENWWGWIDLIADGKIYIGTLEHSANNPLPRGGPYACVNASDGSEIWRVNGMFRETRWGGNGVIGDSIIATMDTYDQRIYAIGKGPSQTTIVAPTSSVDYGKAIIVQGSVTDISAGTQTDAITARFPNGVAAVSDADQSDWMLYVYKQFERPSNATGVPVIISVLDSNGNYRTIGTATSDSTGAYSFSWTPDIPGKYTVYATFAGSNAYYGSSAEAAFVVDEQASATIAPTTTPTSVADQYFVPLSIGMIVAIVAIGAVLALLQVRKHP